MGSFQDDLSDCAHLRPGFPGMQIAAFLLQGPPKARDEDAAQIPDGDQKNPSIPAQSEGHKHRRQLQFRHVSSRRQ